MDKKVLSDYIDACEFIKDTEAEIKKLEKRRRVVQEKVKGSNPEFPYEEGPSACTGQQRRRKRPAAWPGNDRYWRPRRPRQRS